jgi:hypothetical protein
MNSMHSSTCIHVCTVVRLCDNQYIFNRSVIVVSKTAFTVTSRLKHAHLIAEHATDAGITALSTQLPLQTTLIVHVNFK